MSPQVAWGVAGLLLLASELVLPGVFLMWVGLAALGVAAVAVVFEPSLQSQILIFAALAVAFSLSGWRLYYARRNRPGAPEPAGVNDTFALMVGRTGVLVEPILAGQGKARFGDSVWLVEGADLAAGANVRVVGQDGVLLRVEVA